MTVKDANIDAEIARRRALFETAKGRAVQSSDTDAKLYWFGLAATIGWKCHFGQWRDAEIDAALAEIAATLCPQTKPSGSRVGHVVHLTSNILDGGGHTEVILTWREMMEKWGGIEQHFISSEWFDSRSVGAGNLDKLPQERTHLCSRRLTPAQRVAWIYERLAAIRPETIVLHINPNDVMSLCAVLMLRRNFQTKVIFFDHADHTFSVGMSCADRVIEQRPAAARLTAAYRGVAPEKIYVVPLTSRTRPLQAELSRTLFGIPEDATVSMTVAALYKLRPNKQWDYGVTLRKLLERQPTHYHLMVGHGAADVEAEIKRELSGEAQKRVVWLGRRTDLDALFGIADFLIESFPLMGGMLRLDAMRAACPVVAVTTRGWSVFADTGVFGEDYPLVAESEEEVLKFSRMLIEDESLRATLGGQLKERFRTYYSETVVSNLLRAAIEGDPSVVPGMETPPVFDSRFVAMMSDPVPEMSQLENRFAPLFGYAGKGRIFRFIRALPGRAVDSFRFRLLRGQSFKGRGKLLS